MMERGVWRRSTPQEEKRRKEKSAERQRDGFCVAFRVESWTRPVPQEEGQQHNTTEHNRTARTMSLEELKQISDSFLATRKDLRGRDIANTWRIILVCSPSFALSSPRAVCCAAPC